MSSELAKRLTPTGAVTRDLYLRSGNRCAYPGCAQPLMTADGVLVGEIAHIEAALPQGKRFRASMTNEERRQTGNLMLLCGTHHTVVDTDETTWTVEALQELKASHEAIYTSAVDRLRSTVGDVTEGVTWQPAANALAIPGIDGLGPDEARESLQVLNAFAERLATVPLGARSILGLIISRGDAATSWRGAEMQIPGPLLAQITSCGRRELMDYLHVLEHVELVSVDDDDPYEPFWTAVARNSSPSIGWPIMRDLHDLAGGDASLVRRAIEDLDFTVFDQ